jgi:hypothetical protein
MMIRCVIGTGSDEDFEKTADLFGSGAWLGRKAVGLAAKPFTRPATWKVSKKTNPITHRYAKGGRVKTKMQIDPKTGVRTPVAPGGREFSMSRSMYVGAPLLAGGAAAAGAAKSHPKAYRRDLQRSTLSRGR